MSPPRITAIQAVPPTPPGASGARRGPAPAATQPPALPAPGALSAPAPADAPLQAWAPEEGDGSPWPPLSDAALSKAVASAAVTGEAAAGLAPGDMLLFKVLSTSPRLALQRLGALPLAWRRDAADGAPQRPAHATGAMQPDQTAMLRMAWAAPDAGTLASSWRVLVLEHLRHLGAGHAASGHGASAPSAATGDLLHAGLLSRWAFPVHAWAGLPLSLRLLAPRSHPHHGRLPQASPTPHNDADVAEFWGLRLSGELPGLGATDLRTTLSLNGVTLMILVQEDAALQRLRQGQAHLVQAVHRAGWRLRLCQLLKQLPDEHEHEPAPLPGMPVAPPVGQLLQGQLAHGPLSPVPLHGQAASLSLQGLPQALFRVAAEVLIVLGQLGSGELGADGPLSPASR